MRWKGNIKWLNVYYLHGNKYQYMTDLFIKLIFNEKMISIKNSWQQKSSYILPWHILQNSTEPIFVNRRKREHGVDINISFTGIYSLKDSNCLHFT